MLESQKTRGSKSYCIGYSKTLQKYILSSVVKWIAWYNRYFEISEEEYNYGTDKIELLDEIAKECAEQGVESARFLCSDRDDENETGNRKDTYAALKKGMIPYDGDKLGSLD